MSFAFMFRFLSAGISLAAIAVCTFCLPAAAAGLAEDHTVLYYLIEMQRRYTKNCNGSPMPEAPSLMPSEALRGLAVEASDSGVPVTSLVNANGLAGVPFFSATVPGDDPKQAFDELQGGQCPGIMGAEYHYIGAARRNGQWTLLMAAAEPGSALGAAQPGMAEAPGLVPPQTASGTDQGKTPDQISGQSSQTPGQVYNQTLVQAPIQAYGQAHGQQSAQTPGQTPGLPSVRTDMPATRQESAPASPPPASGSEGNNPAPAASIAVHEFEVNPVGKITGGRPVPPEFAPTPLAPPVPVYPDGRPVDSDQGFDPAQPAARAPYASGAAPATRGIDSEELLQLANSVRVQGATCGGERMPPAQPLRRNPVLDAEAQKHARDMAVRNYFSSTTPEALPLGGRISQAGYVWGYVAENIASMSPPAGGVLQSWMSKEDQCKNIMDREYSEVGIGFDPEKNVWVFTLAAPMGSTNIRVE